MARRINKSENKNTNTLYLVFKNKKMNKKRIMEVDMENNIPKTARYFAIGCTSKR
jgi:hypothetical protein